MKKIIASALVALSFGSALLPVRANAGLLLMLGTPYTYAAPGLGLVFLIWGIAVGSPLLIILDGDQNKAQDDIARALANKFPFLADQNEASSEIASAIVAKVAAVDTAGMQQDAQVEVKLSENEVRGILAPTSLAAEQIDEVVAALK